MSEDQAHDDTLRGRESLERRITNLEYIIKGVDGNNGLRSRVGAVERELGKIPEVVARAVSTVRKEFEEREADQKREHRSQIRFSITITVTLVCALISALAIVLSSSGHSG